MRAFVHGPFAATLLVLVLALVLVEPSPALASPSVVATSNAAEPARAPSGLEPRLGEQVPLSARFRSSDGRDVALGDVLAGKPTLLVLAYNRCTMLCSLVLRSVTRLVKGLGLRPGEQFSLVTISIDPTDTVFEASRLQAALLDSAGYPGQTARWTFLVGQRAAIDAVAGAIGFHYVWDASTEQYAHPAVLTTLSASGQVSGYFEGLDPDAGAVRAALDQQGPVTLARSLNLGAILDCFRFDAARTRYGLGITWFLRGGAAAIGIAVLGLLWRLGRGRRVRVGGPS